MTLAIIPASLLPHACALALVILLSACSQLLLKLGAAGKKSRLESFFNSRTLSGCALFLVVTLLSVFAMQRIHLATVTAWSGINYILIAILSRTLLKENVSRSALLGCLLVALGIALFSLPAAK